MCGKIRCEPDWSQSPKTGRIKAASTKFVGKTQVGTTCQSSGPRAARPYHGVRR
jgi:hypothetical protein